MKNKTFKRWKELGFYVRKGEKSKKRNKRGVCVFSEDQVEDMYEDYYDDARYSGGDPFDYYD
jgi:hypothetical protein